jgi:hypothetical protein
VAAHEEVVAALELPALRARGELSPGALGERAEDAGAHLLPFPGERKRGFGLGKPGARSLELAGGSRELTFPRACALLLPRSEARSKRATTAVGDCDAIGPRSASARIEGAGRC